jgi:hypothetical protein
VKAQAIVPTEVVMYLAQVLTDGSVYLAWGMLFVVVADGRLWIMGLGGFGLWLRRHDIIGSMTDAIFDMLAYALAFGAGVDARGSMMTMMMMVVASALCGWLLWPVAGLEVGFAFGSYSRNIR